jgi:hypothetical protein
MYLIDQKEGRKGDIKKTRVQLGVGKMVANSSESTVQLKNLNMKKKIKRITAILYASVL